MMPDPTVRVLVVEDSVTVRRRLCEVLATAPGFEVVGEAADGKRAIELCAALRPDVITMDMMLPIMSGLAATEYIMAHFPTPILIVSSSTNRGELFKTYEALAAGAVDVLEKPSGEEPDGVWEATSSSATLQHRVADPRHHAPARASERVPARPEALMARCHGARGRRAVEVVADRRLAPADPPAIVGVCVSDLPRGLQPVQSCSSFTSTSPSAPAFARVAGPARRPSAVRSRATARPVARRGPRADGSARPAHQ